MNENKANESVNKQGDLQKENLSEQRINNNSLKNLKPYPKGVSGNPSGRKKNGKEFFEFLTEYGMVSPSAYSFLENPDTYIEAVASGLWKRAKNGDLSAIKYLVDVGALNQKPNITEDMVRSRLKKQNHNISNEAMEKAVKKLMSNN